MILSKLAALALAATSTGQETEVDAEAMRTEALETCGFAEGSVIDASAIRSANELAERIKEAGAQPVILTRAALDGQDMRRTGRLLKGGCIIDSSFKGSDWSGAVAPDLRIIRSDFDGADFTGATLTRTRFEGVGLAKADFSHANLIKARFVGAYGKLFLGEARFHHVTAQGAVFDCGITVDAWCMDAYTAIFFGTFLEGADLATLGVWDEDMLRYASIGRGTAIHPRSIRYMQATDVTGSPLILRAGLPSEDKSAPSPEAAITPEEFDELNAATIAFVADRPSFDCGKAKSVVEQLICAEYASALRTADRDMASLYAEAKKSGKATSASQKAWLAQRNRCKDDGCVVGAYRTRLDQLFAALGPRWTLKPGQSVTYREDVLPLPSSMRASDLYLRIRPVLAEASMQYVTLTGMADGSISAEGFALGGNAHMCDLAVEGARFDPETGWYSAEAHTGELVPLFRIWGDRLLMRYSGNMGDSPDEAQDFVSCGARAGFVDLRDLGE